MSTIGGVKRNFKKREHRYNVMNLYYSKRSPPNRRRKNNNFIEYTLRKFDEVNFECVEKSIGINEEKINNIISQFVDNINIIDSNIINFDKKKITEFQFDIETPENIKNDKNLNKKMDGNLKFDNRTSNNNGNEKINNYEFSIQECNKNEELTASQKVAFNDYLMYMIIGNIYSNKDRIPLELTCRNFYNICNSKNSKVPFFNLNDGDDKDDFIYYKPILCFQDTIFINFSGKLTSKLNILISFNNMKKNMELYAQRGSILVIKKLPFSFARYFKTIGNISNINTVCFKANSTAKESLSIINQIEPALMPTIIIFENVGYSSQTLTCSFHKYEDCHLPKSVKKIFLNCGRNRYLSLLNVLKKFDQKDTLEQITFGSVCTIEFPTREELDMISSMTNYFKNVKIVIKNNVSGNIYKFLMMLLDKFNLHTTAKQQIDISIYLTFLEDSFTNVLDRYIKSDTQSLVDKFSLIKFFRIFVRPLVNKKMVSEIENDTLILCLKEMTNLETLEFNYNLIESTKQFSNYTKVLSSTLKNIKLYSASKIGINELLLLGKRVSQIKNLNLQCIRSKKVTLKFILETFKNLTGLHIEFGKSYNFRNILSYLKKVNSENGKSTLNWPNLTFLEIHCHANEDDMTILEEIERNTPRKSGKFMLFKENIGFKIINEKIVNIFKIRIIIQSHSKNYINFRNLFKLNDTYHGDLVHFISREGSNVPYRY